MGISPSNPTYARYFKGKHDDFPPDYGFKAPRKERVMKITEQEMKALQIEPKKRDYCAHLLRDLYLCQKNYPVTYGKCNPQGHAYFQCQIDDYVLGLKEIERNRRLWERKFKKEKMLAGRS